MNQNISATNGEGGAIDAQGATQPRCFPGPGGGGYLGNGLNVTNPNISGGISFVNGGQGGGGTSYSEGSTTYSDGGFGGGGGGGFNFAASVGGGGFNFAASVGGGGGYSGGSGAGWNKSPYYYQSYGAGGGGSYDINGAGSS